MSTATETKGLSKLDLKALRDADRVVFSMSNGEGLILCIKKVEQAGLWDAEERAHNIYVDSHIKDYDRHAHGRCDDPETYRCFHLSYDDMLWRTIAAMLKVADEISLRWIAGTNSAVLEHDLHCDELHLAWTTVIRGFRHYRKAIIDTSVCPDNTARMIRR